MSEIFHYRNKAYNDETVLNEITSKFITLKDEKIKLINAHLKIVEEGLIPIMKEDSVFQSIYSTIIFAGSFYKGTKVGKPDEYDLDLVMKLPLNYKKLKLELDHDEFGYLKLKVEQDCKLPKWETHKKVLDKWLDRNNYLDQNKFRQWMERLMTKTYERLTKINDGQRAKYSLSTGNKTFKLSNFQKSGPAFTITVYDLDPTSKNFNISFDLVPCLNFNGIVLEGYRKVPGIEPSFTLVAKPLSSNIENYNLLWRLGFYEQEKLILTNSEAGNLKPIIRVIKKFRDTIGWKNLASYYIETVFLHEINEKKEEKNFFRAPKTSLFIHMLYKLQQSFEKKKLEFFWHSSHNLFEKMSSMEIENYNCRLKNILNSINKNIKENPRIIVQYILTSNERIILSNGGSIPQEEEAPNNEGRYCIIA